jgi:hypothetical protein
MKLDNGNVLLNVKSGRACDNLARLIGRKPRYWFTFETGGCLAEVTPDELELFDAAKRERRVYWHSSITRARLKSTPSPCWDFT